MEQELNRIKEGLIKKVYRLGPVYIAMYVPHKDYAALHYLCDEVEEGTEGDYELVMCDLRDVPSIKGEDYVHFADQSFRADRFKSGFYLTHHYGERVWKITRGKIHIAIGENISKLFWSFYIKFFLSHYAVQHQSLHLKAAAVADRDNNISLIVGRGSGGKSVLLNKLITGGYRFMSNTHSLITGNKVYGISTAIRFRNDPYFSSYITSGLAKKHIEQGEYIISPNLIYKNFSIEGNLKNIIIANYGSGNAGIFEVAPSYSLSVLWNFSYPLHTYAMKDDYLEMAGGNLSDFNRIYCEDFRRVSDLANCKNTIYCNFNIDDEKQYNDLLRIM